MEMFTFVNHAKDTGRMVQKYFLGEKINRRYVRVFRSIFKACKNITVYKYC
jgi:hypothetical protein